MTQTSLLATKLFTPPVADVIVRRPRLLERMRHGTRGPLTLVSAPAGFGKTTLVSAWAREANLPVAWLSLDEHDRDPADVLAYLVAALHEVTGDLLDGVLAATSGPQPTTASTLLPRLVNLLAALDHDVALVLDDYHAVDAHEVDDALGFLLQRLPPRVHLVMTTREDPDLPLARLRARGHLTELRAADLRFTPDEATAFLNDQMGLSLGVQDIEALDARTEGWIAGLQLAALSLRGREDVAAFVRAFAGDHRFVVDYLVDEVLRRQPDEVRRFLLDTSLLDRFTAPLCEAVTGTERSGRLLQELERANLFLVPLDDRRGWFRYHHLFAEMLRTHLDSEQPARIVEVRSRASVWFEVQGDPDEAVRYAHDAGDLERVADLIERFGRAVRSAYRPATVLAWLARLPDATIRARPLLSVEYARAANDLGDLEEAERRLQDAEAAGLDDDRAVAAGVATARAYLAQSRADLDATAQHARRALELLPEDDLFERGVVACVLGLAEWTRGRLDAGHGKFRDGLASMARGGAHLGLSPVYVLADMRVAQGRLSDADRAYRDALEGAGDGSDDGGGPPPLAAANLWLGRSAIARERGETAVADELLARSERLGQRATESDAEHRWPRARARRAEDAGDLAAAVRQLDAAEQAWHPTPIPDVRPIAAQRALIHLRQGRSDLAERWATSRGLTPDRDADYLSEYELALLARMALARFRRDGDANDLDEAHGIVTRLLALAEEQARIASTAELSILEALVLAAVGDVDAAGEALERALRLAAPERRVRIFTVEGDELERLLKKVASRRPLPPFAGVVAAALRARKTQPPSSGADDAPPRDDPDRTNDVARTARVPRTSATVPAEQPLLDPLTDRELEVLRLIAEGLSNREIADRLYRALPTVKGYTREIFAKLQVHRRTEAVARARDLGLL